MVVNLHIYPSPFKFESRILRESKTLIDFGLVDEIIIASGWSSGLKRKETINGIQIRRFKTLSDHLVKYHKIFLASRYLELYIYITFYYLLKPINIINAHSLMVLPIAAFLKIWKRKRRVIYDAHELETERFGLSGKRQIFSKYVERRLIKYCDGLIVVGDYIRKWYIDEYKLKTDQVYTVRNFNNSEKLDDVEHNYLRSYFDLDKEDLIFIYQGLLSKGRGIDVYIESFKALPKKFKLVLMGFGPLEDEIKHISETSENIFFHKAVEPSKILMVTSSADVGLCLIENYCLSYYFSLPNKFFEYTNAGLPIIGSDFPEMGGIIFKNQIGWKIKPIANELIEIINNKNFLIEKDINAKNVVTFVKKFNWQMEQNQLVKLYSFLVKI